ncbi:hypothetical protein J6590_067661 [Homalodisca vitripennis]|nr:hypothetical protein J6590_067661 [Homalodisca vitripennis]
MVSAYVAPTRLHDGVFCSAINSVAIPSVTADGERTQDYIRRVYGLVATAISLIPEIRLSEHVAMASSEIQSAMSRDRASFPFSINWFYIRRDFTWFEGNFLKLKEDKTLADAEDGRNMILLRLWLDTRMTWNFHIHNLCVRLARVLYLLLRFREPGRVTCLLTCARCCGDVPLGMIGCLGLKKGSKDNHTSRSFRKL